MYDALRADGGMRNSHAVLVHDSQAAGEEEAKWENASNINAAHRMVFAGLTVTMYALAKRATHLSTHTYESALPSKPFEFEYTLGNNVDHRRATAVGARRGTSHGDEPFIEGKGADTPPYFSLIADALLAYAQGSAQSSMGRPLSQAPNLSLAEAALPALSSSLVALRGRYEMEYWAKECKAPKLSRAPRPLCAPYRGVLSVGRHHVGQVFSRRCVADPCATARTCGTTFTYSCAAARPMSRSITSAWGGRRRRALPARSQRPPRRLRPPPHRAPRPLTWRLSPRPRSLHQLALPSSEGA